ncbi:hypothetical protein SUGI_0955120 [Cryptomeria japonica]|nr:hypothetical protein SUGI_0955120 [Cryptomeria japonica]
MERSLYQINECLKTNLQTKQQNECFKTILQTKQQNECWGNEERCAEQRMTKIVGSLEMLRLLEEAGKRIPIAESNKGTKDFKFVVFNISVTINPQIQISDNTNPRLLRQFKSGSMAMIAKFNWDLVHD